MKRLTDNQQKTLLHLVFEGMEVTRWNVMGKHAGIIVKNDFHKMKYALNVKHWNTCLPPAFCFSAPAPAPEHKIKRFIENHFSNLRKMITKNDWVHADKVIHLNKSNKSLILFNLTGIGSHYAHIVLPKQADPYISCFQLIDAVEQKTVDSFKSLVSDEVTSNIGIKNSRRLFRMNPEKRTASYLRYYQISQDK